MATGSMDTGRWIATRIVPPAAAGGALALAPAEGAVLAPTDGAALALPPPHAAMTAEIEPSDRPTSVPRWMNSRRLSRPLANASTTSSCSGVVDLRTLSSLR
jgi:hypothetical protein